jgi:GNAT superfamily N-acetyltransferase
VSVFPEVQARIEELGSACGEYSRLIIADDYRGKELSRLFFRAVFGWAYPRGYVWWFFEVEQWMIDLFRSLHFQVEVLSEGVFYRGVNGHPDQVTFSVLLDIESSIGVLSEEDPNLLSFFTSALHSRPA